MVKNVKEFERAIGDFFLGLVFQCSEILSNDLEHKSLAEVLTKDIYVQLVVNQLAFFLSALQCLELASTHGISRSDHRCSKQDVGGAMAYGYTCLDHDLVDDLWVRFHLEFTSLTDVHEARKESSTFNAVLIELKIAIVNRIVAEFSADFSYFNTWHWLMSV